MGRKYYSWIGGAIAAIVLMACNQAAPSRQPSRPEASLKAVAVDQAKVVMGQTLYVPVYSHIYHYNNQDNVVNLSATLSIRNTDLNHAIIITSVRYYDSDGQLVRQHLASPVELKALAATNFFIAADDTSGGSGASFIVEWVAERNVYEPVVEAVMISTSSSQGISFVSPGKVLKQVGMNNDCRRENCN